MSDRLFRVVLADPPWRYDQGERLNGGIEYDTMTDADICALGPWVASVAAPSAALLLWATLPRLDAAQAVVDAWGFRFKTAVPWVKTAPSSGSIRRGIGFWFQGAAELLIVATRGRISSGRTGVLGLLEGQGRTFYAPRGKHSAKPSGIHDYAEAHLGGPFLELFAREVRAGWTALGHDTGWRLTPSGPARAAGRRATQPHGWWAAPGRACEWCGAHFVPRRADARYHANACRQAAYRARLPAVT